MVTLEDNIAVYDGQKEHLEEQYLGKWILFHDKALIGAYDDFQVIASEAVRRFGTGSYLIRLVGAPPVTLPASVLYRPVDAGS